MSILRIIASTFIFSILLNISFIHAETENCSTIVSADKNKRIAFNVENGFLWSTLAVQSKLFYLKGLQDGISLLTIQTIDSRKSSVETSMEIAVESHYLLSSKNVYNKFISTIDGIYNNTLNRKIPIIEIYLSIIEGGNLENQNNLDKLLSILREKYSND